MLRFMAYCNASKDQEVALTLAMAYLAYWVTGSPCKGSGEGTAACVVGVGGRGRGGRGRGGVMGSPCKGLGEGGWGGRGEQM
jgi:hypothetical protein